MSQMLAKHPAAAKSPNNKWRPAPGPYRIYVSIPCDDGHKLDFWKSLLGFQAANLGGSTPHHFRLMPTHGDSLIPRKRNQDAWDFYHNTADDWLLSIDSDIDFRPQDAYVLFENPGPIMAGLYPLKQRDLQWCINTIPGMGHDKDPKTNRQNVATAGTGFFAVHRHVIGTMIAAADKWKQWPVKFYQDATGIEQWDLFHSGVVHDPKWFPVSPRYLSEDWGFCYMARKLGFAVQIDWRAQVFHDGAIKYPINARRLSLEEEMAGVIHQPDGSATPIK